MQTRPSCLSCASWILDKYRERIANLCTLSVLKPLSPRRSLFASISCFHFPLSPLGRNSSVRRCKANAGHHRSGTESGLVQEWRGKPETFGRLDVIIWYGYRRTPSPQFSGRQRWLLGRRWRSICVYDAMESCGLNRAHFGSEKEDESAQESAFCPV